MFQTKMVEKIKTHVIFNNFFQTVLPFMKTCKKIWYGQTDEKRQCNAVQKKMQFA